MPTPDRRAVIDLGTNTFHLLIADVSADEIIREVYRERIFVKLASEGIGTIGEAPFNRGIAALRRFRERIDAHAVSGVRAVGTAALRTAANGGAFVRAAREEADIRVELIDGDREAQYITAGVLHAVPDTQENILIMDIGGGSTEFIIVERGAVRWRRSFPLGVSVLFNGFHGNDPITDEEVERLEAHLARSLAPLERALAEFPARHLVGAAGTFDVLAERLKDKGALSHPTSRRLDLNDFPALYRRIVRATFAERSALPDVPEERADMIVVAMILLRFVFRLAAIRTVTVSDYAMKEGILFARTRDAE